jgi:hypothetical protein
MCSTLEVCAHSSLILQPFTTLPISPQCVNSNFPSGLNLPQKTSFDFKKISYTSVWTWHFLYIMLCFYFNHSFLSMSSLKAPGGLCSCLGHYYSLKSEKVTLSSIFFIKCASTDWLSEYLINILENLGWMSLIRKFEVWNISLFHDETLWVSSWCHMKNFNRVFM